MFKKRLKKTPEFLDYVIQIKNISEGTAVPADVLKNLEKNVTDSWPENYPNRTHHYDESTEWWQIHQTAFEKNQFLLECGKEEDYLDWQKGGTWTEEYETRQRIQHILERTVKRYEPKKALQKFARKVANAIVKFA